MAEGDTNPQLEQSLRDGGIDDSKSRKQRKARVSYKVVGDSKIPVSSAAGKLWRARIEQAKAKRDHRDLDETWSEAIKYYQNDQMSHRRVTEGKHAGNNRANTQTKEFTETENVVYANVNASVPILYAKNPRIEITVVEGKGEELIKLGTVVERLVNVILSRKDAPGVNLAPKAKRCVIMSSLTNRSYLQVDYTRRETSNEQALAELTALSEKLAKAKTKKQILEAEGELIALEEKMDFLNPSGPSVRFRHPAQVMCDPDSIEDDLSDAKWVAIMDFLPTKYIQAVFGKKNSKGEFDSIYKPSHVLKIGDKIGDEALDDMINSFTLLDSANEESGFAGFGFGDQETFEKSQRSKVWYIWDKVTRRILLYNDKDFKWPIWVWDDLYNLHTYFNLYPLSFYMDPEGSETKGEVTYYLDQQDAINEINSELRAARQKAKFRAVANKNVIGQKEAEKLLKHEDDTVAMVDAPIDTDMSKILGAVPVPSLQFAELFNTETKHNAIGRISSISAIERGEQLRTNTTEDAVAALESAATARRDEKTDAIENQIGDVGWAIAQMCLQFMTAEEVGNILGPDAQAIWKPMTKDEIRSTFSPRVVGGSSAKPTSQVKKREAIQMGQVIGQFARTTPAAVVLVLKAFERAFDEVVITEEDWALLRQQIEAAVGGGQGEGGANDDQAAQIVEVVDKLPEPAKKALGEAIARGVPFAKAVQRIVQTVQQGAQANGAQ